MKKIHKQVAVICTFRTSKQKHFLTESPGGKSACVHGRECIGVSRRGGTARDFFSCAQFPRWRGRNKRCCLFFLQQRSHKEKQMTVILGLELTNITCCSSSESDDKTIWPTVSMAAAKFAWCMRRQSSLWNVIHYDSAKCIFNERLRQNPSTMRVSRILHKRTVNWGE